MSRRGTSILAEQRGRYHAVPSERKRQHSQREIEETVNIGSRANEKV